MLLDNTSPPGTRSQHLSPLDNTSPLLGPSHKSSLPPPDHHHGTMRRQAVRILLDCILVWLWKTFLYITLFPHISVLYINKRTLEVVDICKKCCLVLCVMYAFHCKPSVQLRRKILTSCYEVVLVDPLKRHR